MHTEKSIEQLKESYYQATGKDFSEWEEIGISYVVIPDTISLYILHQNKQEKTLDSFKELAPKYYGIETVLPEHVEAISEFLTLFRQKRLSNNKSFISAAVSLYLPFFKNKVIPKDKKRSQLPQCQNKNEIFLDLITGFNFIQFYPDLKEDTFYYLVDTSLFACEGLRQERALYPRLNIQVIRKSVLKLKKEDFKAPVSVLRAKNLFGYVPICRSDIEHFQSLIRPGGQFIFQEHAGRERSYPTQIAPWFKGWKKTEILGNPDDRYAFDTITYVKPE